MRWLEAAERRDAGPDAILRSLVDEVRETSGMPAGVKGVEMDAVGDALRLSMPTARNGHNTRSQVLRLSACAFRSMGSHATARRLVLFAGGLAKAYNWEISAGRKMWVVDMRELIPEGAAPMELTILIALETAVCGIAEVWDATDGKGILGIRNLGSAMRGFAPSSKSAKNDKRRSRLQNEMLRAAENLLIAIGDARGWKFAPEVIKVSA